MESEDVAWGAMRWQRCGSIFTWKRTFQSKSAFSRRPAFYKDGVLHKALVHKVEGTIQVYYNSRETLLILYLCFGSVRLIMTLKHESPSNI